jgi:hypothetical protein
MYTLSKYAAHAAALLAAMENQDQFHTHEDPNRGPLPQPRGATAYGTGPWFNGTGTLIDGTSTRFWSVTWL